jgi:hypothetical protein
MNNNLIDAWPLLLGWPAIVIAIVLAAVSIHTFRPWYAIIAAIAITPISFYLSGSPRFGWLGVSVPVALVGLAAWLGTSRRRTRNR